MLDEKETPTGDAGALEFLRSGPLSHLTIVRHILIFWTGVPLHLAEYLVNPMKM